MPSYPLPQTDDIIGPIIHQLAIALSTKVQGLGRMYEQPPDGPPENNSVIFPVTKFVFESDDHYTNGKMCVTFTIAIRYMIRRSKAVDDIANLYKAFSAFTYVLSSWPVQNLNGTSNTVTPKSGGITQFVMAGQPYMALVINTDVLTEFPILTT